MWGAVLDAAGVLADAVSVALPFVPGGASAAIAGFRSADALLDAARTADGLSDATDAATHAVRAADGAHNVSTYSGLPIQKHHFATDKHRYYTPEFKKIIERYGLDIDGNWNTAPLPHRGRHPNEYHEYVINGMQKAAEEAGDNAEIFLQKFNEYVIEPVKQHPELLRKESWR